MRRAAVLLVSILCACGDDGGTQPQHDAAPDIDAPPDAPPVLTTCAFSGTGATCGSTMAPTTPAGGTVNCDVLLQTGCAANEKCTWIVDQANPPIGHIGCAPNGTVATDCPCTVGAPGLTGYDDCARGDICVTAMCRKICDLQGGAPTCDAEHACGGYAGLFDVGGTNVAGACDPRCDPLTQCMPSASSEMGARACGSMNAATPDRGCYGFALDKFICTRVPMPAQNLTDRMPAYGPGSGGAFVNGCAPGYMPFFRESTGSQVIVCAGTCAPADTDVNRPGTATGDSTKAAKLHNQAEIVVGNALCVPGKKGSEAQQNCVYSWIFNFDGTTLPPSPYNDTLGLCLGYTHYTYDHDADPGTPNRPYPSCESLPSRTSPPANCTCAAGACTGTGCPDGAAHEWGCWNSNDSLMPFTSIKAVRDFRLAHGVGPAGRHLIR